MSTEDWDKAAWKPDVTDKQLPAVRIRTSRLAITDVTETAPLSSVPVFCRELKVKAESKNKGIIYIGADISIDLRNNGYPLEPGAELSLPVNDLGIVFYQGDEVDDGLRVIYFS